MNANVLNDRNPSPQLRFTHGGYGHCWTTANVGQGGKKEVRGEKDAKRGARKERKKIRDEQG